MSKSPPFVHENGRFRCPVCGWNALSRASIINHFRYHHSEGPCPGVCPLCKEAADGPPSTPLAPTPLHEFPQAVNPFQNGTSGILEPDLYAHLMAIHSLTRLPDISREEMHSLCREIVIELAAKIVDDIQELDADSILFLPSLENEVKRDYDSFSEDPRAATIHEFLCREADAAVARGLARPPTILSHFRRASEHSPASVKNSGVTQILVLEQQSSIGPLCGHHAFYNCLIGASLCCAETNEDRRRAIARFCSRTGFWLQCTRTMRLLHRYAQESGMDWEPWTWDHIRVGEVERAYVEVMLEQDAAAGARRGRITCLPAANPTEIATGSMTAEEVAKVQSIFDEFSHGTKDTWHCFMVGARSHWIAIVARKEHREIEVIYLESHNQNILNCNDSELWALCRKEQELRRDAGLKLITDKDFVSWHTSLINMREICKLMVDGVNGQINFITVFLDGMLVALVECYNSLASSPSAPLPETAPDVHPEVVEEAAAPFEAGQKADTLATALTFAQDYNPPGLIRNNINNKIRELGPHFVSLGAKARVTEWILSLITDESLVTSHLEIVSDLVEVLTSLMTILNV